MNCIRKYPIVKVSFLLGLKLCTCMLAVRRQDDFEFKSGQGFDSIVLDESGEFVDLSALQTN